MIELLRFYRRVLDHIHFGGNIYNDKGRFEAYKLIALIASNLRNGRQHYVTTGV